MDRLRKLEIDIKREISFIINNEVKDPRIGFITITDVELSPDHQKLKVFVSIMGEEENIEKGLEGLNNSIGFIKKKIKDRLRLRKIPYIKFIYDKSIDKGLRISKILDNLNENKDIDK